MEKAHPVLRRLYEETLDLLPWHKSKNSVANAIPGITPMDIVRWNQGFGMSDKKRHLLERFLESIGLCERRIYYIFSGKRIEGMTDSAIHNLLSRGEE